MKKLVLWLILLLPLNVSALTESVVDLNGLTIKQIQNYVDLGYLTYEQIVHIYLDRIDAYNDQYNALITINEDALNQAKELDKEYQKNGRKSLIYGLPIIVKDNIDVVGLPTTNGTKALLDSYPIKNAPIIQKLVDAGAIVIAKANMDEFAFNAAYSHSSFGFVYNAYNTSYSSYGSSGGTAVGVASNLAVAGIGTDTGSSIRIPSSANNLVGLRPTFDSIEMDGIIKFEPLRDIAGPMTKFVEDSAIILEIMDNTDVDYQTNLIESNLDGIKVGVLTTVLNNSSSFIKEMVQKQINVLKSLGAQIVYLNNFPVTYKFDATTLCYDFNQYIQGTNGHVRSLDDLIKDGNFTQYITSYNGYYCNNDYRTTSTYQNYVSIRKSNINIANNRFESNDIDVLIYPTLQTSLLKMNEIYSRKLATYSSNLAPLVGFPSMNIPIGFYNDLPYGMEIVAQANNEPIIYKLAYNLEKQNNYYKLPSIASSLYTTNDNIQQLLTYYQNNHHEKEYKVVQKEIKDFINNYNNIDNKEDQINQLLDEYHNVPNVIADNQIKAKKRTKIIVTSIGLILIFRILFTKKKAKNEKTKRNN